MSDKAFDVVKCIHCGQIVLANTPGARHSSGECRDTISQRLAALSKENKRLREALRMIEEISAENNTKARDGYAEIYTIAHGCGDCHDGCPVKQEGISRIAAALSPQANGGGE